MMYKYLFFDDRRLCGRKNVIRQYGKPTLVERYSDGVSGCDRAPVCVFKTDDGKYRMLYFGKCKFGYACLFVATSDDGIHFSPENISDKVGYEGRNEPHEILRLSPGDEIGTIIDDPYGKKEERYKMLYCRLEKENVRFVDEVYVSPDLLHWKKLEGVDWNKNGTEPITSAFYNHKRSCYTIISRPLWGTREVGIIETKDFRTFSPYVHAFNADSLDGPIEEFYGLPAFEYDGYLSAITNEGGIRLGEFDNGDKIKSIVEKPKIESSLSLQPNLQARMPSHAFSMKASSHLKQQSS